MQTTVQLEGPPSCLGHPVPPVAEAVSLQSRLPDVDTVMYVSMSSSCFPGSCGLMATMGEVHSLEDQTCGSGRVSRGKVYINARPIASLEGAGRTNAGKQAASMQAATMQARGGGRGLAYRASGLASCMASIHATRKSICAVVNKLDLCVY